jgi:CheY-like chemotaxis protein
LVVDPRKPFRSGICVMLEALGHRVIEALDAPEALAMMDAYAVEVVLVDLASRGLSVSNAIRMDSNIPLVAVTRRNLQIRRNGEEGCFLTINAPFNFEDLVDTVAQAVAHGRAAAARETF